ncbi:hypothetical protein FA95DRAFT_1048767 [Auriscalpium vulgare]|uniref:Uncharacterized protein n=1 Tax=Auriscalpium vulgare TaxID=40419 RepID=A0ACB8SAN5_9AGAM|nr:hypothetical protein FA95DRAFT_1048767 [Auriscalpium vulgare]
MQRCFGLLTVVCASEPNNSTRADPRAAIVRSNSDPQLVSLAHCPRHALDDNVYPCFASVGPAPSHTLSSRSHSLSPSYTMAYSSMTSTAIFPSSSASSNAFALFGQSPRDNYAMYEDLRQAVRPSNGPASQRQRQTSATSTKFSFKKMFAGL